jgi:hypothetical protein
MPFSMLPVTAAWPRSRPDASAFISYLIGRDELGIRPEQGTVLLVCGDHNRRASLPEAVAKA